MKKRIKLLLIISCVFLFQNCKKKGDADIISRTASVSSWGWSSPYYFTEISIPELTSSNINTAGVMVYFSHSSGNWIAIPYTQYHSPYNYVMNFSCSPGNVEVTWFYDTSFSAGSDPNTYYGSTIQIKVVVIPPAERIKNPNVNLNDYNEVKRTYKLRD
jgi:hypothetical protein